MSVEANNLGDAQIARVKKLLKKKVNKEVKEYVEALERAIEGWQRTCAEAIKKLREDKTIEQLKELRKFVDLQHFVSIPEDVNLASSAWVSREARKHNEIINEIRDRIDAIIKAEESK